MSKLNADPAQIKSKCAAIDASIAKLNDSVSEYSALSNGLSSSKSKSTDAMKEVAKAHEKAAKASIAMLSNVSKVLLSMGDTVQSADNMLANKNKK